MQNTYLEQAGYKNGVKPNFGIYCPAWVFVELGLNASQGLIYSYFYSATQNNKTQQMQNSCWAIGTFNFLSSLTGLTKKTVINIINDLVGKNLLIKRKSTNLNGSSDANVYCAVVPENVLATGFSGGIVPENTLKTDKPTSAENNNNSENFSDISQENEQNAVSAGGGVKITLPSENFTLGWCKNYTTPSENFTPLNKYKINNKYIKHTSNSTKRSYATSTESTQAVMEQSSSNHTTAECKRESKNEYSKNQNPSTSSRDTSSKKTAQTVQQTAEVEVESKQKFNNQTHPTRTNAPMSTPSNSSNQRVSSSNNPQGTNTLPEGYLTLETNAIVAPQTDASRRVAIRLYREWLDKGYTSDDILGAYKRYRNWHARAFGASTEHALSLTNWLHCKEGTRGFTSWFNDKYASQRASATTSTTTNTQTSNSQVTQELSTPTGRKDSESIHIQHSQKLNDYLTDGSNSEQTILKFSQLESAPSAVKHAGLRVKQEFNDCMDTSSKRVKNMPSWQILWQLVTINNREKFEQWVWTNCMKQQVAY